MDMTEMLLSMERLRQKYEHGRGLEDYVIRVCQAIVAGQAGYKSRAEWSSPIFEQVDAERRDLY